MHAYRCQHCGGVNRLRESAGGRVPVCGRCKKPLDTNGQPQAVDSHTLQKLIDTTPVPLLVDFWAPWCGPCRMAAPVLERVARAHAGEVIVVKVNSDEQPDASAAHHVQAIPTFAMFQAGRELSRQAGLLPEPAFDRWVSEHLSG